jgi:magnesium chelatase subunit D
LRAAAPWQPLRRGEGGGARLAIRRDDLRVTRFKRRTETTTVFVVDASGSAAFHRLAEAKGAVELLLADCYVRRDRVALLAFRGAGADLLLPPTRSLTRAKRSLASLPGGGGTPLAAAIDAARDVADGVVRAGGAAILVFFTDGRANVGRDGRGGREQAAADAKASAERLRSGAATILFIDTSPRPHEAAASLASAMGARYLPLPSADSATLSGLVRGELAASGAGRGVR